MATDKQHDVDVRINSRINFYGPVVMVGSISVTGVGLFIFILWTATHWAEAIMLSAFLTYGAVSLFGLTILGLVAALWVRLVVKPYASLRSPLIHVQDNAVVVTDRRGNVVVKPLFPGEAPGVVEAAPNQASEVLDMYAQGFTQQTIAESLRLSQPTVSRIINKNRTNKPE